MIKVIIYSIMFILIMYFFISILIIKKAIKIVKSKDKSREQLYYDLLNLWLENRNNGKYIKKYLEKRNVKKIGIYGCGEIGKRLAEELINKGFYDISFIDSCKNVFKFNTFCIETKSINEFNFEDVQMIIVTPIHLFDSINENLKCKNIKCEIISFQKIVEDMFFNVKYKKEVK